MLIIHNLFHLKKQIKTQNFNNNKYFQRLFQVYTFTIDIKYNLKCYITWY